MIPTISVPYDFVGGTKAIADQVDANFTVLVNAINNNVRNYLLGPTTFYIAPGGVDAPGNGLAGTSPAATVNYILNLIQSSYDINGETVTIQLAAGTYNQSIVLVGPLLGAVSGSTAAQLPASTGMVVVQGNVAAPGSVTVVGAVDVNDGAKLTLRGLTLQNAGNMDGVSAWAYSTIIVDTCNWNANAVAQAGAHSTIWLQGPQTINANTAVFAYSYMNSVLFFATNATITIAAGVAITQFAVATTSSTLYVFAGATFSGTNTGARFGASRNGYITHLGATAFPGVAPADGNCSAGGRYHGPDGNFPSVYQISG